ncbi:hypothetical protein [Streptomyces sp. WAC01280]|uniref:hypothetical protein n=1 Tax=Streptomyces sp. WAC01280 TaxID=2487424 RepID=UPI000F770BE6|nr:hypothetical protein [Streptomyces sp. WAC01280]RSS58629.1 hypothetical protein EF909_01265 [Streptomyces sp. WAC01280]
MISRSPAGPGTISPAPAARRPRPRRPRRYRFRGRPSRTRRPCPRPRPPRSRARRPRPTAVTPRHAAPAPQERSQVPDDGRAERPGAAGADAEGIPDLLGPAEEGEFRRRWHEVQGRFVDDPRQAVHAADALVGDVMRTLADTFARHRHNLEGQWSQGLEADTESLRLALCQYRALLQRLLST